MALSWIRIARGWALALAWLPVLVFAQAATPGAAQTGKSPVASYAFFYGADIPWESLGAFDMAVVEPDHVGPEGWSHRLNPATTVAAYVSVGEAHPSRAWFARLPAAWKLGENKAWGSVVVDQAAPGWSEFYLREVIDPLWARGFRAFFLDTLDSFNLVATTPQARSRQEAGLVALVRAIRKAHPEARLVFNRGFEILPQVHELAEAVAAESLFQGWDAARGEYREVSAQDRDWLWAQLRRCRDEFRLPVIAIDYVDPARRELARETARRIRELGAIPWVTNPALDLLGVGAVEVLPRQVLAIHDEPGHEADLSAHAVHRIGTMPLNHLGLDVRYVAAGSEEMLALARQPLAGRYAGVVTWFSAGSFPKSGAVLPLLRHAREQGVPLVMVGALPDDEALDPFGIDLGEIQRVGTALTVHRLSPHVGFEIEPSPVAEELLPIRVRPGTGEVWLRVRDSKGTIADAIAVTNWGGYAAERYWKVDLPGNRGERWAVNPIEFLRAALRLDPDIPVPDVTTDSGRRLFFVHVDGDGFPSRAELPGTPLAAQVMLDEFLTRYRVPSTVSVIQGEIAANGLFAALAPQHEALARRIFALPHVELATHTYSHPFVWADLELGRERTDRALALRLGGYRYDVDAEIAGSARYIDTRLAPSGKRTAMVLWSGDTQPLRTPVRKAYEAGLRNMNSGNTWITRAEPTLTLVGPLGMMKGNWFQVYAPNQNENVYTNQWSGPYYGFERVIETFELTERPLRLKPVNIYYHIYNTSKRASVAALHRVYQWAMAQPLHPVHASGYFDRVLDWRRATVARLPDGRLELRSGQTLRQWRIDAAQAQRIDWAASSSLAGAVRHETALYLHAGDARASLALAARGQAAPASRRPRLLDANQHLMRWQAQQPAGGTQQDWRIGFDGFAPLQARLMAPGCTAQAEGSATRLRISAADSAGEIRIEGQDGGPTELLLRCPR